MLDLLVDEGLGEFQRLGEHLKSLELVRFLGSGERKGSGDCGGERQARRCSMGGRGIAMQVQVLESCRTLCG